jgi:hypothetical protein
MPRKLSPEKQLELESLYRIVGTIADWFDGIATDPASGGMAGHMRRAYDERDLAGLRMACNDLVEMTNAATPQQRRQLDMLLRDRANTTLEALSAKKTERIKRLRARGKLTSEEQYYLVREHAEFIANVPERAEEFQHLISMMHAYEDRVAAGATAKSSKPRSNEEL